MTTKNQESGSVLAVQDQKISEYRAIIDDQEYVFHNRQVLGRDLMAMAGIPEDSGLVQILEDGTQQIVHPDDLVELKPGHRFKKAPRFKRG